MYIKGILITIEERKFFKKNIHFFLYIELFFYLATAAAVADPSKNLEAREAELLYSHSSVAVFLVFR